MIPRHCPATPVQWSAHSRTSGTVDELCDDGTVLDSAEAMSFLGGASWRKYKGSLVGRASWPLARLTIHPEGITFSASSRWVSLGIPTMDLRWQDIESIARRHTGVLIKRSDEPGSTILFQLNKDAILNALARYPVRIL